MPHPTDHISVCICTYKRPAYLQRLLEELDRQETGGEFTFSIVVADNDRAESAKPVLAAFAAHSSRAVDYCVEPEPNIALTRNRALRHTRGNFVAFIDDDEFPTPTWLRTLFAACRKFDVDGVLGPVKPHFEVPPPAWIVRGRFHDRPTYPTGYVISGPQGRTGNVLLKRHLFAGDDPPFRAAFLTGEDQDFFRRMIERGHVFIWCDEALAYETVPAARCTRSFLLRRALFRGAISRQHPTCGAREVLKSMVAVPAYGAGLPVFLLLGQHLFMKYLVKTCDHLGRLLATVGFGRPKRYVTE